MYIQFTNQEDVPTEKLNDTVETKESFTFAVFPDTQHYSQKFPEIHRSQTDWVKENAEFKNIKAVITLGDIVQKRDEVVEEWENASETYEVLDEIGIPYNVIPGNHDITKEGETKLFNQFFPPKRFIRNDWYGGHFGNNNRNNYIFIDTDDVDFILVSLEYCPPDNAVKWATEIFDQFSHKVGILATHAFLNEKGLHSTGCMETQKGEKNTGENLWEKIVVPSENIQMVMNGHFHHKQGGVYKTQKVGDRTVHQLMSNYQDFPNGGNGYLRIMEFFVEDNKVDVKTYSPYIDEYLDNEASEFSFELNLTN